MGMQVLDSIVPGGNALWGEAGVGFDSISDLVGQLGNAELAKALTFGEGAVALGDTGGRSLRTEFLHGKLEKQSFDQEDATTMRIIPKPDVKSTAVQWTTQGQYGGPGSGFIPETGSDGAFGVNVANDNFKRRTRNVKFLAAAREIGILSTVVDTITNPEDIARDSATMEIIGKSNRACAYGNETVDNSQPSGFSQQIKEWAQEFSQHQAVMYDAQGGPIDPGMIEDLVMISRKKFGRPSLLLTSTVARGDSMKLLFPSARFQDGTQGGSFGVDRDSFTSIKGKIRLEDDVMYGPNKPLSIDGTGADGKVRAGVADAGSLAWNGNPWTGTGQCVAATQGSGFAATNTSINTDAAGVAAPATPSGDGNWKNNLGAGTFYYAASIVYQGLESLPWVFGAAAVDTITGASGVAVTAAQIVSMSFDYSKITGLGSTYDRKKVYLRVYRFSGSVPTATSQFDFLFETGWPTGTTANSTAFDNGFNIPGSDDAWLITEKKGNLPAWGWGQLLPMISRPLPNKAMSDLLCMLSFGLPLLWIPGHHIHIRNIGRYKA